MELQERVCGRNAYLCRALGDLIAHVRTGRQRGAKELGRWAL